MPVDVERFRTLLEEERRRVLAAIDYLHKENPGSIEDEAKDEPGNELAEIATATLDHEIDDTLEENAENVRAAIDAALQRIEDGTYGKCENCGKEIGEERLSALPWATLCIDCRRLEERG